MLAVFNMIPISPLDGSQIFSGMMIRSNPDLVMKLQMYGPSNPYGAYSSLVCLLHSHQYG